MKFFRALCRFQTPVSYTGGLVHRNKKYW